MRWRGNTMRRMSTLADTELPPLASTEDALQKEMETGMSVLTGVGLYRLA